MAKSNKYFKPTESQELKPDETQNITEIRVSPDYYIHQAITKAIESLSGSDNLKEGMTRYRMLIEQLEILVLSQGKMTEDYNDKLEEYKQTEEYNKNPENDIKSFKLAQYKFKLIMQNIADSRTELGSVKL